MNFRKSDGMKSGGKIQLKEIKNHLKALAVWKRQHLSMPCPYNF